MKNRIPPFVRIAALVLAGWVTVAGVAPAAQTITYHYDAAGRLTSFSAGGPQQRYTYDAAGNALVIAASLNADSDNDGLDDAWELQNLGSLQFTGAEDFDRDGASNLTEFLTGTNPADAASAFRISSFTVRPAPVLVQWRSVAGKNYRVQFKNALSEPTWSDLPGDVTASSGTAQKSDPAPNATARFYRVILVP
jgi:YD repeat-containing protein